MKEKLIVFVIGLLLGAIISTGSIYCYTLAEMKADTNINQQFKNRNFMPNDGRNPNNNDVPPEMPDNTREKQFN